MAGKYLRLLWALALGCGALFPANAHALIQDFSFKGDVAVVGRAGAMHQEGARLLIDYRGELRIGTLAGDPVVSLRLNYKTVGGAVTIPTMEPGESWYETIDLDQIPNAAEEKIGIYNVKIRFWFSSGLNEDVTIIEDAGVFFKQGQWSYNVPSGYNWNKLFVTSTGDFTDRGVEFVDAERAKAIYKSGLTLKSVEFVSAELALTDLHAWWRDNDRRSEYAATVMAIRRVAEGLYRSYGLTLDNARMQASVKGYGLLGNATEYWQNLAESRRVLFDCKANPEGIGCGGSDDWLKDYRQGLAAAKQELNKLVSLPRRFRKGDNHDPFRQALLDAQSLIKQAEGLRRAWEPSGTFIAEIDRGAEPKFDLPNLKIEAVDGQRYVSAGGKRLHGPYAFVEFVGKEYVITGTKGCNKCTHRRNERSVLRDAVTGRILRDYGNSCARAAAPKHIFVTDVIGDYVARKCSPGLNLLPCGKNSGVIYRWRKEDYQGNAVDQGETKADVMDCR